MQAWVEYVVKGLVEHPEAVTVTPVERNGVTIYQLRLHPEDVGRVVGRQGSTINALRALLLVGSAKRGLRCALDIVEDAPKGAPPEAPQTEPAP
jgi:predicted RNA-binding protein YlqC (UPF0109 family)